MIADQFRTRGDLRPIIALDDVDVELRLLVGRRELVTDQTRRLGRLRDLLTSIFPGLESVVDVTGKASLCLLSRCAGRDPRDRPGAVDQKPPQGRDCAPPRSTAPIHAAVAAAKAQRISVPGEAVAADLIRDWQPKHSLPATGSRARHAHRGRARTSKVMSSTAV